MSDAAQSVESQAVRWDCRVDDDVIDAVDEDHARVTFIQALIADPSLIYVRAHREDGYGTD